MSIDSLFELTSSGDFLITAYNLEQTLGRSVTIDEVSEELKLDWGPADEIRWILSGASYVSLDGDDDEIIEILPKGQTYAETLQQKHSFIARFLTGTIGLSPYAACENAAMFRHVLTDETIEEMEDYDEENGFTEMPEENLNFFHCSLKEVLKSSCLNYLIYLYFADLEQNGKVTVDSLADFHNMTSPEIMAGKIKILEESGYVQTGADKVIRITPDGNEKLKDIMSRHDHITELLKFTLEKEDEEAQKEAWFCQFLITDEAFHSIEKFLADNGVTVNTEI